MAVTEVTSAAPTTTGVASATPLYADYVTSTAPEEQTFEVAAILTDEALQQTITPEPPPSGPPPTYSPEQFETGIFPDTYGPLVKSFSPTSHWQGLVNNERTFVYAGARTSDTVDGPFSDQGLIYIVVYSADLVTRREAEYAPPGGTGALTIAAESNLHLTLTSASGVELYFDIPTRSFLDDLTSTVAAPSVTPIPPAPPTIDPLATGGYPMPPTLPAATAAPPN